MIVWLASFPRSGNGFFRVVSRTLFSQEIHSIYPEKNKPVNAAELQRMQRDDRIYLVKTHELPIDTSPAIYLVRDGRDSLVSLAWFHLTSQNEPHRNIAPGKFKKKLQKEINSKAFGGWSGNCLSWTQRDYQTVVVRFEDLTSRPENVVGKALEDINVYSQRTERSEPPTFEQLQHQNLFLYRKGQSGDWRNQMSEELHELFWQKHGEAMRALDYEE